MLRTGYRPAANPRVTLLDVNDPDDGHLVRSKNKYMLGL
jgi:hypothetical protein